MRARTYLVYLSTTIYVAVGLGGARSTLRMRVITADDAMGKKKKGGKTKKENAEGGLPPPPNLDSYKEGAREALLTFKLVKRTTQTRVGLRYSRAR